MLAQSPGLPGWFWATLQVVVWAPSGEFVSGWGVGLQEVGSGLMFSHVSAGGGQGRSDAVVSRVVVGVARVAVGAGGARRAG